MFALNLLFYTLFFLGAYLLGEQSFSAIGRRIFLRRRLNTAGPAKRRGRIASLMERLSYASFGKDVDPDSLMFFLAFLFIFVFVLAAQSFSLLAAAGVALALSGLPLMLMAVKLESGRNRSSKEGLSMLTEFYRQYRMKNLNIYEAIEGVVNSEGDYPVCRKQLYRLLLRLRAAGTSVELRQSLDGFAFALGTLWGRMFAVCLRMSAEKGVDISEGLADIITQLKNANSMAEDRKRLNSEAGRMTIFLVPLLYAGTMFISVYYLEISPSKLFKNQFFTPEGLLFFIAALFLFFMNLMLLSLAENVRLDY